MPETETAEMPQTTETQQTATGQGQETGMGNQTAGSPQTGSQQSSMSQQGPHPQGPGGGMAHRGGSQMARRGYRDPFSLMHQLSDEMDRLFADFGFGGMGFGRRGESSLWAPHVDVSRRGNDLVVCVDLPGMKKEDIHAEIREDHLVLQGERRSESVSDREGMYSERSYGRFFRTIPLPEGVDPSQAQADFRDGVLEIRIPLPQQQEQQSRRIEIR